MGENQNLINVLLVVLPTASIGFAFLLGLIIAFWKVFVKAGKPGWACLIPIYNLFVLIQIVKKPWWWLLLLLIPYVNLIFSAVIEIQLAKAFGKSALFGIFLLWLLPFGYFIIGFDDSKYLLGSPTSPTPQVLPTTPPAPVQSAPAQMAPKV